MLEMNTQNVNVNVSNITGNSKIEDKIVATFNANYSTGMMNNYSVSKNINNMDLYNANTETVDSDYIDFECQVKDLVLRLTDAVEKNMTNPESFEK